MANSIKFDNTEIRDLTHVPRFVKHESVADRQLTTLPLAREDGEVLISSKFGIKKVLLQGILTGTTKEILEAAIDTFKELFSRQEKNLDVDWNGATLRFVATCSKGIEFDRDHFHILFVPWTAEFTVLSGEGKDTSTTKALDAHAPTGSNPYTDPFTLYGTKPPKPVITIEANPDWDPAIRGIEYKNTDTGEKIQFTKSGSWNAWHVNYAVKIDCLLKKVTSDIGRSIGDFLEYAFYGVFPKFKIGTNNISIKLGGLVNQTSGDTDVGSLGSGRNINSTNIRCAQAFSVPYTDATFQGIILALYKYGSPGNITVRIETDNGNKPSGSLVDADAVITILPGDVAGAGPVTYVTKYSTDPWTMPANTKCWIVVSAAGVNGSDYYEISFYSASTYTKGIAKYSTDGGSTYAVDPAGTIYSFKVLFGGVAAANPLKHTVEYTKTYL